MPCPILLGTAMLHTLPVLPLHEIYVLLHPSLTFTLTTVTTMYANTTAHQMKIKMASLNLVHDLYTISYRLLIFG